MKEVDDIQILYCFGRWLGEEKKILLLKIFLDKQQGIFPEDLVRDLGISRSTVFKWIKELVQFGLIEKKQLTNRHRCYVLKKECKNGSKLKFKQITIDFSFLN